MTATLDPDARATAPPRTHLSSRIWSLVRPSRWRLAVVALCIIASAVIELIPPFVVRYVVNHDLTVHHTSNLFTSGLVYLGAVVADAGFSYGYAILAASVSQSAIAALRVQLFAHLMTLPTIYFDRTPIGELISRLTSDVETIDELFTSGIITLIGQLVSLIAVAVAMLVLSPVLTLVSMVVLPPLLIVVRFLQVRVRDAERETRVAVGRLNSQLAEVVGAVETLRAFGREDVFIQRFRSALRRTLTAQRESVKFNAFFAPVSGLLSALVIAALLWVAGGQTLVNAAVNVGTLTAFILLFQRFFAPIVALGDEWQSVQAAIAGSERLFEVLDIESEEVPSRSKFSASQSRGVVVRDVRFGYHEGHPVIDDVSIEVHPGEHVTVVGRTGAGKSTLISLIGGLYAPWAGSLTVNGVDPRSLTQAERRLRLGVVPQAPQLLNGTLRDNLTLFDPTIDDEAIQRAIEIVGLSSVIDELPQGLATVLSGGGLGAGAGLSAGQRQLVALARALVTNPPILLLDEPTAAIDAVSDDSFRRALRDFSSQWASAVITVAHRISTAQDADRVVVLEHGRVVEVGRPSELITTGGRFAALVELDTVGWGWKDVTVESNDAPVVESSDDPPTNEGGH